MFEDLKNLDFTTPKDLCLNIANDKKRKVTLQKERIKSYEEMIIANFCFMNGIHYQYEKPFEIKTESSDYRQYNPDFTLTDYEIYHEHYGVDEKVRCTQYRAEEEKRYLESVRWKDTIHGLYKTKYIKTYSHQVKSETLFEVLEKQLKELGVIFKPLSQEEMKNAVNSIYNSVSFKSFIHLIKSFLNLYKSRYQDDTYFEELKEESFSNAYASKRTKLFLDICKDVYVFYRKQLCGKIDFDDMILEAMVKLPSLNSFKYKYIIVDEFQDISYSRMRFLQSLIKHGDSKLFAVGDDWQSIYRFSGCDIGIFLNFGKYFEMATINKLSTNFRNSVDLHKIVESFITSNPEQMKKEIECKSTLTTPLKIMFHENDKNSALDSVLSNIAGQNPMASVLILGRNNYDIDKLKENRSMWNISRESVMYNRFPGLRISLKTVHGSKELEDDCVVLLNNDDSKTGFPNKIIDDPIRTLVLSDKSEFKFAEERRLYYER